MSDLFSQHKRIKLSKHHWRKLTMYVAGRDKRCVFCGNPNHGTPAHLIRRSQGGDDSPRNVVQACIMKTDGTIGCHTLYDTSRLDLPDSVIDMLENEPYKI